MSSVARRVRRGTLMMVEDSTTGTGFNIIPRTRRKNNRKMNSQKRRQQRNVFKLTRQLNLFVVKKHGCVVFKHEDKNLCELLIKQRKLTYIENGISNTISI